MEDYKESDTFIVQSVRTITQWTGSRWGSAIPKWLSE